MKKRAINTFTIVRSREEGWDLIVRMMNLYSEPSELPDDDRELCGRIEMILEAMTGQRQRVRYMTHSPRDMLPLYSIQRPVQPFLNKEGPDPDFAIWYFNELAKKNPVTLKVTSRKTKTKLEVITDQEMPTPMSYVLLLMWQYYFKDNGWLHIKRCPTCERWFHDKTGNARMIRCSADCTWKYWSRGRRKEAGHGRGKKRKPVVRRKTRKTL